MPLTVQHFAADGVTPINAAFPLPDAYAGVTTLPVKFGFTNTAARALTNVQDPVTASGSNDGASELRVAPDTVTISHPFGLAVVLGAPGAGGIWGTTGIRGWVLTALNANGETIASDEVTINIDDVTRKATLTWTLTPGATGYRIYRTTTPGTYVTPAFRTQIGSGAVVTFVDDGTADSAGAPSSTNTTGGGGILLVLSAPGAGGVWGGTGPQNYRVAAFDTSGALIWASLEAMVNVDTVSKTVTISWTAVPSAATYTVYRSVSAGVYVNAIRASGLVATNYIDTGGGLTAGTLSAAASYGVTPDLTTFGLGPLALGTMQISQQVFYWVTRVVAIATSEDGNPRIALLPPKET